MSMMMTREVMALGMLMVTHIMVVMTTSDDEGDENGCEHTNDEPDYQ